jgi:transposase
LEVTLHQAPPAPLTHWTTRRLGKRLGVSHMTIARGWQRAGLRPHRVERYTESPDPDFERKAADIIGLYLNPPQHAAVLCVDEKTAIQGLDRTTPVLPLSPGRAERHGFEYVRHGTLSLYAALNVHTGRVLGDTVPRHTALAFVDFLDQVVATQPRGKPIHIVADNLSAHKAKPVQAWLGAHPRVTIHYTPTYSSWLNQVELWFARIERDCIARGIFSSTTDLRKKLLQYIKLHNATCQPFLWRYRDPKRRIRASRISATVH